MAEFQEVMRQWRRMCEKHTCDNRDESGQILPLCPLVTKHYGYPCDDSVTDLSQESVAQVEEIVMSWAAENPEPVYPTWGEWLDEMGVVGLEPSPRYEENYQMVYFCKLKIDSPIPADIAQKLGIEPKEGA